MKTSVAPSHVALTNSSATAIPFKLISSHPTQSTILPPRRTRSAAQHHTPSHDATVRVAHQIAATVFPFTLAIRRRRRRRLQLRTFFTNTSSSSRQCHQQTPSPTVSASSSFANVRRLCHKLTTNDEFQQRTPTTNDDERTTMNERRTTATTTNDERRTTMTTMTTTNDERRRRCPRENQQQTKKNVHQRRRFKTLFASLNAHFATHSAFHRTPKATTTAFYAQLTL